jgi:hypothetical protein
VCLNDYLEPQSLKHQVPKILNKIQVGMDQDFPGTQVESNQKKIGLHYVIEGLEVEIQVGVPNVMPGDFLSLQSAEDCKYLSPSVSHLATRFIANQNVFFKDLVRVVNHWRDSYEEWPKTCKPT